MIARRSMSRALRHWAAGVAIAATFGVPAITAADDVAEKDDYPTTARVDYVLACMAANGQNYLVMQKCACSIDVIASMIPYEQYERVETILRMREGRGELGLLFRTSRDLEAQVQEFKQVQVEADLRCF